MKARLITRYRNVFADGSLVELAVWNVSEPVPPSTHSYKYRLVYIVDGIRVIGFDNERGKGDHQHENSRESPYIFTSVDQLLDDFFVEVELWRTGH